MLRRYDIGDVVNIRTGGDDGLSFQEGDGTLFDPVVVRFRVKPPGLPSLIYLSGSDSEVVRNGQGDFSLRLPLDREGEWIIRVEGETGSGEFRGADERRILVRRSSF